MWKIIPAIVLVFAVTSTVLAKDNLAILPFTGGAEEEGETIAELFSFEPALAAFFNPVPRTSINRATRSEQRFQRSGMTDPDTIAELGRQLGAQYVVSGSISTLGSQKLLIIAILKIDELRQIAGDIQTYNNIEEIQDKLPGMARNIVEAAGQDASRFSRLSVVPVQLSGGADGRDADVLARILAVHIIRGGKYAVYPRTVSLEQVQAEYANQFSGETAEENLPDVGRGTNPSLVLSVTARKLGSRNMFNAAIINMVTGIQEAGETVSYHNLNDGIEAMVILAAALSGNRWDWIASSAEDFSRAIAAINADTKGGDYTITLSGSFYSDGITFTANAAKTITLKGDGSVRTITNNKNVAEYIVDGLFTVPKGISLVLDNNVTLNGNGKYGSLVYVKGGTFTMKTGSMVSGSAGTGVDVSGSFTADGHGGGVWVGGGSFTMTGGTISGNASWGVRVDGSSFTMSGGTISNNTGGGVLVASMTIGGQRDYTGSFMMTDGTISGNITNKTGGGGVTVYAGSSFTMIGGTISGNSTTRGTSYDAGMGGGVFVSGSFTMIGGTISGNRASNCGGGVYVSVGKGGSFVKQGGTIDATNSANTGRIAYVRESKYRLRNSAAGPNVNMDSRIAGRAGGWEEEGEWARINGHGPYQTPGEFTIPVFYGIVKPWD